MSDRKIEEYRFLKAGLEDIAFVSEIVSGKKGNSRHAVCAMYDAIEFILYEIFIQLNIDIYATGQNTIGLDNALSIAEKRGIEIPLRASVRDIQKHRGDAKHHAQIPEERIYRKMQAEFRVIVSRLVHEQFGEALGRNLPTDEVISYHSALYDTYRKHRTHNWDLAFRFAVGAVLHKLRAILERKDDYQSGHTPDAMTTLKKLEDDTKTANYSLVPKEVASTLRGLAATLRRLHKSNNVDKAAEEAGKAYSQLDQFRPSLFEVATAKKLTANLYLPSRLYHGKAMGWSKWQLGDTQETERYLSEVLELLRKNPDLTATFEMPFYDNDDDHYWKWWEFVVFDGSLWHTFCLDDGMRISLESGRQSDDETLRREHVAKLVKEEFQRVATDFNNQKSHQRL